MRSPRLYRANAVILRDRRVGEADKILTLFSAEQGKFDAIAKGVRRPTSRKRGHLEVLSSAALLLAKGRNLDVITQSETLESFGGLRDDLQRLGRAIYLAELTDRFAVENVEQYPIYQLLVETLRRLETGTALDLALRYFELQLLSLTGYQPQLRVCVSCHGPIGPVLNYFSPSLGGAVCSACRAAEAALRPLTVNALKVLRLLQAGPYAQAARLRLTPGLAAEVEDHLRFYIRHLLEREVRSREFLRSLRQDSLDAEGRLLPLGEAVLS